LAPVTIGCDEGNPPITLTIMTTSKAWIVIAGIVAAGFAFNTTFAQDIAKASESEKTHTNTVKKEKNLDYKVAKAAKAERKHEMKANKAGVKAAKATKADKASKALMKREKKQKMRQERIERQKNKPQPVKQITPW
jgi:hypothetical protein